MLQRNQTRADGGFSVAPCPSDTSFFYPATAPMCQRKTKILASWLLPEKSSIISMFTEEQVRKEKEKRKSKPSYHTPSISFKVFTKGPRLAILTSIAYIESR